MSLYSNIYAECVGYAFSQCFFSEIAILRDDVSSDEAHMQELKDLVAEFEMAMEIVEPGTSVKWCIDEEVKANVKNATCLDDCYAGSICAVIPEDDIEDYESNMPCDNFGMLACSTSCPKYYECQGK